MSKKESQKKWYEKSKIALLQKREQQLLNIEGIHYKGFIVRDDGTVINKFGNVVGFNNGKKGYKYIYVEGRKIPKHRFIWEAFNGEIPEGMEIDHVLPISDGGTDELSNLRLVTPKGNRNNPLTLEKYKISNKGKGSYKQRMRVSMFMWMHNKIKRHHKMLETLKKVNSSNAS